MVRAAASFIRLPMSTQLSIKQIKAGNMRSLYNTVMSIVNMQSWVTIIAVQAEQFNDAIQIVRNWLPEAEAELKLHSIPDDEESIMQAIENHEVRRYATYCTLLL